MARQVRAERKATVTKTTTLLSTQMGESEFGTNIMNRWSWPALCQQSRQVEVI